MMKIDKGIIKACREGRHMCQDGLEVGGSTGDDSASFLDFVHYRPLSMHLLEGALEPD